MGKFLLLWTINAISLFIVSALLPGVEIQEGVWPLVVVATLVGLINATLRPLLYLLSCGCIILTLGLAIPVLNALLLLLADRVAGNAFNIESFGWAVAAALLMGFINFILSSIFIDKDHEEPHVIRSQ